MEGIVIRTHPFSDYHLVVCAVTREDGKLAMFARNARRSGKRYKNVPDLFDLARFTISSSKSSDGGLPNLQDFQVLTAFPQLRANLDKLTCASVVCEAADLLLPEQGGDNQSGFDSILECFQQLQTAREVQDNLRASFFALANLLEHSGYLESDPKSQPSRNNLRHLLMLVEQVTDRELKSKPPLLALLRQLTTKSKAS